MCTMIVEKADVTGSGKNAAGWFALTGANVSYDHPFHAAVEHAVNIDFVNEAAGPSARVAVELTLDGARAFARALLAAIERAEAYESPAI